MHEWGAASACSAVVQGEWRPTESVGVDWAPSTLARELVGLTRVAVRTGRDARGGP